MIQFTKEAVEKVQYFLENAKQPSMVLRIAIEGEVEEDQPGEYIYGFKLEPEEKVGPKDLTMPAHGFLVRMDSKCAIKLASSVVDWESKDGKAGFSVKRSQDLYDPKQNQGDSITQKIEGVLRTIFDPEIPVNIYDMGLIYNFEVDQDQHVDVLMTLTAPNCPAAEVLPEEVKQKILTIDEVVSVDLKLTWEPAWTPDLMSEAARLDMGM